MNEITAIIAGYLLGSIPTAYIVTRLAIGQDIRRLGGGNVGGLNTFLEVGTGCGVAVGLTDCAKGAAAVAIAYWVLAVSPLWVMLAGLAAVIGHMYMAFLKFSGGKGMGPAFGGLAVALTVYGYGYAFFILLAAVAVPFAVTRNVALSMGVGLVGLPFILWLTTGSGLAVSLSIIMGILIGIKFLPTATAAWTAKKNFSGFIFGTRSRR